MTLRLRAIRRWKLKFTPLEFETSFAADNDNPHAMLKFTPLEFETLIPALGSYWYCKVKIYSVGV